MTVPVLVCDYGCERPYGYRVAGRKRVATVEEASLLASRIRTIPPSY